METKTAAYYFKEASDLLKSGAPSVANEQIDIALKLNGDHVWLLWCYFNNLIELVPNQLLVIVNKLIDKYPCIDSLYNFRRLVNVELGLFKNATNDNQLYLKYSSKL